jgi:hypothetical protein
LKISVSELKSSMINSNSLIDSLNKELIYYRVKEDYFSDALGDQSNRFALIVTGILALMALVSFGSIRYEMIRIKKGMGKQLSDQMQEFNDYKEKIKSIISSLNVSRANTFSLIAKLATDNKEWLPVLSFNLSAARDHSISAMIEIEAMEKDDKLDKNEEFKFVINNLKKAIDALDEIKKVPTLKQGIKDHLKDFIDDINLIDKVDFNEVKDLVAEIRNGINNYIK